MVIYRESTLPFCVPMLLCDLCVPGCFIHFVKVCLQAEKKVSLLLHIKWLLSRPAHIQIARWPEIGHMTGLILTCHTSTELRTSRHLKLAFSSSFRVSFSPSKCYVIQRTAVFSRETMRLVHVSYSIGKVAFLPVAIFWSILH